MVLLLALFLTPSRSVEMRNAKQQQQQ